MNEHVACTRATYDKVAGRFLENARDRSPIAFWLERFARQLDSGAAVLDRRVLARAASFTSRSSRAPAPGGRKSDTASLAGSSSGRRPISMCFSRTRGSG
jgi:hypothetical protein